MNSRPLALSSKPAEGNEPIKLYALLTGAVMWLLCGVMLAGAADSKAAREEAILAAQAKRQVRLQILSGLNTATQLHGKKEYEQANRLLSELEAQAMDASTRFAVYRLQCMTAVVQNNFPAAQATYQKIFDIVLKPDGPPEEIAKERRHVLSVLNTEYPGVLLRFKQPPLTEEFKKTVRDALNGIGNVPGRPLPIVRFEKAFEQRELARELIKESKRAEGLEAYRVLFEKYPEFQTMAGLIINTRLDYVEAHGYLPHNPEYITLLEKLYSDPAFQNQPPITTVGVRLGRAYIAKQHPRELAHWKQLVERIEGLRKHTGLRDDPGGVLPINYEVALVNYGEALSRKNDLETLASVVQKLEINYGSSEGGKAARRLKAKLNASPK